ncbi:50S ribosomal protein L32 [Candidatus Woesebacteria bacterium RBG_19FT_COMBO_42_9]|uniref:Large ribosomal subunit protein bL32 n=1 Tax=Candidatus Woesebacteria bacterium RBG_16_42_24 TaxID=1802485 RepID=A0A1F7XK19_9BACT|nr:MAG: 50S ribosomal protein L32 [Candidatus Woesebacteria bacterium RBG_16_42_24]OGM16354.1 MAG: 50S ribosomal protein L32 [Candidatus Woesebacteria bacterium RBG_19FT_COMBO_42_9]OGM67403.1 MAG: 50S ribosomal protein L32 [Candidatus Woesebacteria bacterium RIFCSPLOWO2_01_FULL_43_11]
MAPVPKKKSTKGRSGRRQGKKVFRLPNLTPCPNCKKLKEPHRACPYCGFYK